MKMSFILKAVCVILLFFIYCGANKAGEVCFPFGTTTEGPPSEPQQGRPGRIGPIGVPGQKGERGVSGPPGQCACDPNEIERLREEIEAKDDRLIKMIDELREVLRDKLCFVGMKDGRVADEDITASSTHDSHHHPKDARLDKPAAGSGVSFVFGGWAAARPELQGAWIQVDLKVPVRITGVVTQGVADTRFQDRITSFKISYGNQTQNMEVMQHTNGTDIIFPGNQDARISVTNIFPRPIVARYIRLIVQTWHNFAVVRLEYLTC